MNRIVYVLDASGSMHYRASKAAQLTKAAIKKLAPTDRVTILTFDDNGIETACENTVAKDVAFDGYKCNGLTNLRDAVHEGCERLIKQSRSQKDTFTAIILTDGAENASRKISEVALKAYLKKLIGTDRWTIAWLVPPDCVAHTRRLGGDNVFGWEDIEVAAAALSTGMDNLAASRKRGETSLKSGFFANLNDVKKADIRAEMTDVSSSIKRAKVTKKQSIKEFCLKNFGSFVQGNALYELTKAEKVQSYKEIALIDKRRPHEVFLGGRGILGLPDGDVKLKPGELGNYRAFVGSTSVNRATDPGTEILYGDQIGKVK